MKLEEIEKESEECQRFARILGVLTLVFFLLGMMGNFWYFVSIFCSIGAIFFWMDKRYWDTKYDIFKYKK